MAVGGISIGRSHETGLHAYNSAIDILRIQKLQEATTLAFQHDGKEVRRIARSKG